MRHHNAECIDCGAPCTRNNRIKGWIPPAQTRCRACWNASRKTDKNTCLDCGADIDKGPSRCRPCWRAAVMVPFAEQRRRNNRWRPPVDRAINSTAYRKLRAVVLGEEPTCQIGVPDVCTLVSVTVDHIVPRSVDPSLTLVRSNLRGACWECNSHVAGRPVSLRPRTAGNCDGCGESFVRWGVGHRYCSRECGRNRMHRVWFPVCTICMAVFCARRSNQVTCSPACRSELTARKVRDRYRAEHGIPVDPSEPVKRRSCGGAAA